MKKLAVPFLVLSLAAFGCSSSSNSKDASGGSGGSAGGSGGSTGGTDGSAGGSGGTTDGGNRDLLMASCTVVSDTDASADQSMTLSAADFCTNLQAVCAGMLTTAYMGATCMTTYNSPTTRKHCQSYHLCWGVEGGGGGPALADPHCGHAQGMGVCAPLDAAAGN